ncbi:MAG: glycosyltransferase [Acetobacter sp.]|nr:glycosyltransferase [Acetobacter sp.]
MRRLVYVCVLIFGGIGGWLAVQAKHPFGLNYRRVVLNLPVTYSKFLQQSNYALGEKYLAEDMANVLQQLGFDTKIYALEDVYSNKNFRAGYEIYMRAFPELQFSDYHNYFDNDKIAVLYETIPYTFDEVAQADVVFTGSMKKNREYREKGIYSHFLPQFTRLDKFYYAPKSELKTKLLFVGNRWPDTENRKSVQYAMEYGLELDVYGAWWDTVLTGEYAKLHKGKQILSDKLKYYYSSADIVLNDTREDMIEAGFISNRIFDVTACGGFIISDYIPEIEEIYGDTVPMYKTKEEFKMLIDYYLAHPEERREKALRAQKITRERFGAEQAMAEMMRILEEYRRMRGLGENE